MGTGDLLGKPNKLLGSDLRWTSIPSRGSRNKILLAASCYGNRDKLRPDEPVGSIRLTFFYFQDLLIDATVLFCFGGGNSVDCCFRNFMICYNND